MLDIILLTVALVVPNPFLKAEWPTAVQFRFDGFSFFYIFLAGSMLAYSWRTVQSLGQWTVTIWLAAVGLTAWLGTSDPALGERILAAIDGNQRLFELIDPNSIQFQLRIQEIVIFLLVSAILGLKARRSALLLARQADIAAERANLARYFAPSMVEELATRSEPMGGTRRQHVAVLFADIVGFTRLAEDSEPEAVMNLLRDFHAALEEAVFTNGGTLDKYLGDGIMATFGTPVAGPDDAANAMRSGMAMLSSVAAINQRRQQQALPPIHLSVGIHYGPVMLGDIGTRRRMEFATLGDTVNVAARIEAATRKLNCRFAVSSDVMQAAVAAPGGSPASKAMRPVPAVKLRGRADPVDLWVS
jgi:adenylate cyclase